MFKDNRTALGRAPRRASDKDFPSRAENAKDHVNNELLCARQLGLAAALTNVPFPLICSTETARRSCRNLNFSQKTTADISRNFRDII
jgi:hypothetical protein